MFNTIKNAWKIPDLRKKILYTLLIIIVFRFGSVIPVPFLDISKLGELMSEAGQSSALGYINMLTGGAFSYASLFAMGITPYINSSIIMQLLTIYSPLEKLSRKARGRKKIATITRYVTVVLGLIQGVAYYFYLRNSGITKYSAGGAGVFTAFVIVLTFTAGTALIMWMGEQINEKGIGNGISIILLAGIVARLPVTVGSLWQYLQLGQQGQPQYFVLVPLFIVLFLAVVWVIVFMNDAERRIPVQYAKEGGRPQDVRRPELLPSCEVAMSGVMPVIFASAILSIPQFIQFFVNPTGGFWKSFFDALLPDRLALYSALFPADHHVCIFLCRFSIIRWKWPIISARATAPSRVSVPANPRRTSSQDPFQDYAHRRPVPRVRGAYPDHLQQPDRYARSDDERNLGDHYRRRSA